MKTVLVNVAVAALLSGCGDALVRERRQHSQDAHVPHWSYKGDMDPNRWGYYYPECRGASQSPIDLHVDSPMRGPREEFEFSPAWSAEGTQSWLLKNNGHAAQVDLGPGFTVRGGSLGDEIGEDRIYTAKQFHFHWTQSEHTVDGAHFPIEMHIVTSDAKLGSKAAVTHQGLAVLGFFFEEAEFDNELLKPITDNLQHEIAEGSKTNLPSFNLLNLISSALSGRYWRYNGSLTTPPCSQSVLWTVFENRLPVSRAQIALFAKLASKDGQPILANNRPVQDLNCREVFML